MNQMCVTSISSGNLSSTGIDFCGKKILIIGKRCSGKSSLIAEMLKNYLNNSTGKKMLVLSSTEQGTAYRMLENETNFQFRILKKFNTNILSELDPSSFLVLDECTYKKKEDYEALEFILTQMPEMTLIIATKLMKFDLDLCVNFDYFIINNNHTHIHQLYRIIPIINTKVFNNLLNNLQNYEFLVIDKNKICKEIIQNQKKNNSYDHKEIICNYEKKIQCHKLSELETFQINTTILITNINQSMNTKLVENIICKLENQLDEIVIFNRFNINNYPSIVSQIYSQNIDIIIDYLLEKTNHSKNKMFIIEYSISKSKYNKEKMSELFIKARHYNITLIIVEQMIPPLPSDIRGNINECFTGQYIEKVILQKMYSQYFGIFENFNQFTKFIQSIEDDQYLMINNLYQTSKLIPYCFIIIDNQYIPKNKYNTNININREIYINDDISTEINPIVAKHLLNIYSKITELEKKVNELQITLDF